MDDPGSDATGRDSPRSVVVDTDLALGDEGSEIDDGLALALALATPKLEVLAVTTVNGNTHVETASVLTREWLDRLGAGEVPIHIGARDPLGRSRHQTEPPRLDDARLRVLENLRSGSEPAAAAIVRLVRTNPGRVTLIAIGPLTNIALAIAIDPAIVDELADLYVMGGYFFGHTNRSAMPGEFNVWADPTAFDDVLLSGVRPHLIGLDVTRRLALTQQTAQRMAQSTGTTSFIGRHALAWIEKLRLMQPDRKKSVHASYLHDPLVVAALIDEDIVTWQDAYVRVGRDAATRGITVADTLRDAVPPPANARIAVDVDTERFDAIWATVFPLS